MMDMPSQMTKPGLESEEFKSIRPIGDRVVLKQADALERTKGGIFIPETAKEKPTEGLVVSVGDGRVNEAGITVPVSVKIGDHVLFNKFAGQPVTLAGQEFIIIREGDILGVLAR